LNRIINFFPLLDNLNRGYRNIPILFNPARVIYVLPWFIEYIIIVRLVPVMEKENILLEIPAVHRTWSVFLFIYLI